MNINNEFKAWVGSDYPCDQVIVSDLRNKREGHELNARFIGLLDVISQVAKAALELLFWPVLAVGLMGYGIISFSAYLIKGNLDKCGETMVMIPLTVLLYVPCSVLNRVRLIAVDLLGLVAPRAAAIQRQEAFKSFICNGKSPLSLVYHFIK